MHNTRLSSIESYNDLVPKLGARQAEVLRIVEASGNATNSEIAQVLNRAINTIVPRCHELREKGLVSKAGRRKCRVTLRNVNAWKIGKIDFQNDLF